MITQTITIELNTDDNSGEFSAAVLFNPVLPTSEEEFEKLTRTEKALQNVATNLADKVIEVLGPDTPAPGVTH